MTVGAATLADDIWTVLLTTDVPNKYRTDFLDSTGKINAPPIDPMTGRTVGYLIAYFGAGRASTARLGGAPNRSAWTFQVTCAGGTDAVALGVVDEVRSALTGLRVHGGKILEGASTVLSRDDTTEPTRAYVALIFDLYLCG